MKKFDGFTVDPHRVGRRPRAWYSPHRAIIALAALLIAVAFAGALLGVVNSSNAEKQIALLNDRYLVLQPPVRDVRAAAAAFQVIAGPVIAGSTPDTGLIDSAVADSNAFDKNYLTLDHLLALPGSDTLAPLLSGQVANYVAARSKLGAYLAGEKISPATAQLGAVEQAADEKLDATLASLQATLTNRLMHAADEAQAASDDARTGLLWCLFVGGTFAIAVTALFARARRSTSSARWPTETPRSWCSPIAMSSSRACRGR